MPARSVASTAELHPHSIETGDVIFVTQKATSSMLSRAGQWLLVRGRRERPDRFEYAHVAMGISPGLVVHSDGKLVRFEALETAIHAGKRGARFRISRRTGPPLSDAQKSALRREAERYLAQRYSFVPGRYSSWFGRMIRSLPLGLSERTRPFCSELIVYAYRAAGLHFGLHADRAFPADLDRICRGPGWSDVTSLYIHESAPEILAVLENSGISDPAELALLMQELQHDMSGAHATLAMGANAKFGALEAIAKALSTLRKTQQVDLQMALLLSMNPRPLMEGPAGLLARYLEQLPAYYDTIETLPGWLHGDLAKSLSALFPDCPPDQPPLEGLPSLAELQRQDSALKLAAFGIATIRLEAILGGLCAQAGCLPADADSRFHDIPRNEMGQALALLPPLASERAQYLGGLVRQAFDHDHTPELRKLQALANRLIGYHLALQSPEPTLTQACQQRSCPNGDPNPSVH